MSVTADAGGVELLYISHNRQEFVAATFEALIQNTNWERVRALHVVDDSSRDGTAELLSEAIRAIPCKVSFVTGRFGGPVAAMNHALDRCRTEFISKVDSDLTVCPGWLDRMIETLTYYEHLDALGTEPGFGASVQPISEPRTYLPARWIGGQGLFRMRIFRRHRPKPNARWFGLTQFWRDHAKTGWITPQIACFNLDHIPAEPWRSLALSYVRQGWSREWECYPTEWSASWSWWLAEQANKMETAAH